VKARFAALPPRAQLAIAAAAVLVWALALWFLLVAPKRSHAAGLSEDVAAAEFQLADAQLQARRPQKSSSGPKAADVLRLAKAMPSSADQAGLVLELDRLARSSGVTLRSITPSDAAVGAGGATTIPVVVTATGSYRQITRFLQHTRALVRVRGGAVRATGRLLTMQGVELAESSTRKFPYLDATITLNAFVYDGPIVPATPPPTSTDSEDTSTGATAAGSTP
jgi:Tfp pilus assembly protein PilO